MPVSRATPREISEQEAWRQRQLVLDQLSRDEREPLEQRLMADDDYFYQLLACEDELIDAAVAGELEEGTQARLVTLPELDRRLAFARTLNRVVAHRAPANGAVVKLRLSPCSWRRWAPWLAVAAVLVMAIGLLPWRGEQPFGTSDLGSSPDTFSAVLPPSVLRGHGTELGIAAGIKRVELYLELAGSRPRGRLRAVLHTGAGRELARWERLSATTYDWGTAIRIELPAAQLTPGTYSILVLPARGKDQAERVGEYSLTVSRPEAVDG